ncbi:MAG TPA: hypothetical protein VHB77_20165, partial [Planctomycetaceae bacterium]|nr:hypothetical protein [Planctomycetaceae bacterium]
MQREPTHDEGFLHREGGVCYAERALRLFDSREPSDFQGDTRACFVGLPLLGVGSNGPIRRTG